MLCVDQAVFKKGRRFLVRCDLDVPVENNSVSETFRLESALKTLNYIIEHEGLPIICGHMGRPGGKVVPALSTDILNDYFSKHLLGKFELLENLRFDPGEEANEPNFTEQLSQNAEIYVNESFANCHRASASIVGVSKLLPSYGGFHLVKEVEVLSKVLTNPARPLLAIIGGAKIETKKPVIDKFAQIADGVLVGGKLALEQPINMAKVYNPVDYVGNKDIGPSTLEGWKDMILSAKTIVWSGPMGAFEEKEYSNGTETVANYILESVGKGCFAVVGGGDTVSALDKFGIRDKMSFVSTGGGAMLDFLVCGTLPGIEALNDSEKLWQNS